MDERFNIAEKLALAENAYQDVKNLRVEQTNLHLQINSMELIYREFVRREKETLTQFLTGISDDINDLYLFMNADKRVEGIRLIPLGNDEEFVGGNSRNDFSWRNSITSRDILE